MIAEQHPNIISYMRGIQAFNENDLDTAKKFFSEDIVYRIPGRNPIAGEYRFCFMTFPIANVRIETRTPRCLFNGTFM